MEGEGQFDGAEVRSQVAARLGDGGDDEVTDLAAQLRQVGLGQLAQVVGVTNPFEEHAGTLPLVAAPGGAAPGVTLYRRRA